MAAMGNSAPINDIVGELISGNTTGNIILASIAAGIYFLFMLLTISNIIRDKRGLHIVIILFCAVRIVAFSVRAYMQKHLDHNLAIVYEVFSAVGFVFLVRLLLSLQSHWSREASVPTEPKTGGGGFILGRILNNQSNPLEKLVTLALVVGVILAIIGGVNAYDSNATLSKYNSAISLMKAGYTIFLICIVAYCFLVIKGPLMESTQYGRAMSCRSATFVALALLTCGMLLTIRSVFQVVAIYDNPKLQFESKFFYPLIVILELGVLAIICAPGFINHVLKGPQAQRELDPIHPPTIEI